MPSIIAENAYSSSFKDSLISLFFVISAIVAIITFCSKITERKNEKKALSTFNAVSQKQQKRNPLSFSNSLGSFPLLLFLGTLVLAISELKNYHMFYAYLYFYSAALFPLAYAIFTHSKISGTALIIFYGNFFNRKCIAIPCDYIEKVELSTYENTYMASAGGRIRVPYKATQIHEAIKISIKNDYSLIENQFVDEGIFKIFSKKEITSNKKDSEILINLPPIFGFKKYLAAINQYATIKSTLDGRKLFVNLHHLGNMSAFLILIVAMIGLYLIL